jgi:hypothetical protein
MWLRLPREIGDKFGYYRHGAILLILNMRGHFKRGTNCLKAPPKIIPGHTDIQIYLHTHVRTHKLTHMHHTYHTNTNSSPHPSPLTWCGPFFPSSHFAALVQGLSYQWNKPIRSCWICNINGCLCCLFINDIPCLLRLKKTCLREPPHGLVHYYRTQYESCLQLSYLFISDAEKNAHNCQCVSKMQTWRKHYEYTMDNSVLGAKKAFHGLEECDNSCEFLTGVSGSLIRFA